MKNGGWIIAPMVGIASLSLVDGSAEAETAQKYRNLKLSIPGAANEGGEQEVCKRPPLARLSRALLLPRQGAGNAR